MIVFFRSDAALPRRFFAFKRVIQVVIDLFCQIFLAAESWDFIWNGIKIAEIENLIKGQKSNGTKISSDYDDKTKLKDKKISLEIIEFI